MCSDVSAFITFLRNSLSTVSKLLILRDSASLSAWEYSFASKSIFSGGPDGACGMEDISKIARLFGHDYPDPSYDANCDINNDQNIDMKDVSTVAKNFGKVDL